MRRRPSLLWLTILAMAVAGCSAAPTLSPDAAATAIAATVEAMAAPTPHSAPPTAEPTSEPTGLPPAPSLRVVYVDAGELYLVDEGAAPVRLTVSGSVESVRLSDDGRKIAYTRRPGPDSPVELRVVNDDGSGDSVLMSPADFDALYPLGGALHHDLFQFGFLPGTHLLLLNTRSVFEGPGLAKLNDLIRIDTDSLSRALLLAPGSGGDFTPSPDGQYLALTRPTTVEIRLVDGSPSGSGVITYAPVITYSEYAYYAQPVWDPGSTAVGVVIPSADPLASATSGAVWRLPVGGSAVSFGTISAQFFLFGTGFEPLLSPDLARVAYTRPTTTLNVWSLYRAAVDGSGETLTATGDVAWAGWSPDGAHFVYSLGGPMALQLGNLTGATGPLVTGTDLRWFTPSDFLYASGSIGAWTLNRGGIGVASTPVASPTADFIAYDFVYR